jgi:hypothetical protein
MSRQSIPAGPLARTDDPRSSSRHYATQLRKPSLRGRGFYYPASLLQNKPGSLRPYDPARRANDAFPSRDDSTPMLSGAIEPCYVVLPFTSVLPSCDSLLASMLRFCGYVLLLCFSLLCCCASCVSLLAFHCPCFTGPISLPTRGEPDMAYNKIGKQR